MIQQLLFWVFIQKETKTVTQKRYTNSRVHGKKLFVVGSMKAT